MKLLLPLSVVFSSILFLHAQTLIESPSVRAFYPWAMQSASSYVTAQQYCDFLNDVATEDPDGLFDGKMETTPETASILRCGTPGSYFYEVIAGRENIPITHVNEFGQAAYNSWTTSGENSTTVIFRSHSFDPYLKSNRTDFYNFLSEVQSTLLSSASTRHDRYSFSSSHAGEAILLAILFAVTAREGVNRWNAFHSMNNERAPLQIALPGGSGGDSLPPRGIFEGRESDQKNPSSSPKNFMDIRSHSTSQADSAELDSLQAAGQSAKHDDAAGMFGGTVKIAVAESEQEGVRSNSDSDTSATRRVLWADNAGDESPLHIKVIVARYQETPITITQKALENSITEEAINKEKDPVIKDLMIRFATAKTTYSHFEDLATEYIDHKTKIALPGKENLLTASTAAQQAAKQEAFFTLELIGTLELEKERGTSGSNNSQPPSKAHQYFMHCMIKKAEAIEDNNDDLATYWSDAATACEAVINLNALRSSTLAQKTEANMIASSKMDAARAFQKGNVDQIEALLVLPTTDIARKLITARSEGAKAIDENNILLMKAWSKEIKIFQQAYDLRKKAITATPDEAARLTKQADILESTPHPMTAAANARKETPPRHDVAEAFTKAAMKAVEADQLEAFINEISSPEQKKEAQKIRSAANLLFEAAQALKIGKKNDALILTKTAENLSPTVSFCWIM